MGPPLARGRRVLHERRAGLRRHEQRGPLTCGVFSKALLEARKKLGDAAEGVHATPDGDTVAALGPPNRAGGLIGDGVLTRNELERAVFTTAEPGEFDPKGWTYDPIVVPTTDVYYTQQGYGIASVESASRAVGVITGAAAVSDRSDVDAWIAIVDGVRDTV